MTPALKSSTPRISLNDLRQSALAAANPATHAATGESCAADTLVSPCGTLRMSLTGERIASAAFRASDDPLGNAFLELYCREIEQLPREEAAAHGASYVGFRLLAGRVLDDCAGIPGPANLHPLLAKAESALRALRQTWRAATDTPGMPAIERAEFLELPAAWLALSADQRLAALRTALAEAIGSGTMADDGLTIDRIENDIRARPVRVTLTYAKDADTAALPAAMRRIEALLRQKVAPWLEVYAEERQDHNKLRRTILIEPRPPTT
ncbi:MAG: hypothetical protein QG590_1006 [Pseudomonadota bacterium]|nr:hypothetical protein [Pseudomonadota bacterium]